MGDVYDPLEDILSQRKQHDAAAIMAHGEPFGCDEGERDATFRVSHHKTARLGSLRTERGESGCTWSSQVICRATSGLRICNLWMSPLSPQPCVRSRSRRKGRSGISMVLMTLFPRHPSADASPNQDLPIQHFTARRLRARAGLPTAGTVSLTSPDSSRWALPPAKKSSFRRG